MLNENNISNNKIIFTEGETFKDPVSNETWKHQYQHQRQTSELWHTNNTSNQNFCSSSQTDAKSNSNPTGININLQSGCAKYNKRLVVQINPLIMYNKNQHHVNNQLLNHNQSSGKNKVQVNILKQGNSNNNNTNYSVNNLKPTNTNAQTKSKTLKFLKANENKDSDTKLQKSNSNTQLHNAFYFNNRATEPGFMSVRTRRPIKNESMNLHLQNTYGNFGLQDSKSGSRKRQLVNSKKN